MAFCRQWTMLVFAALVNFLLTSAHPLPARHESTTLVNKKRSSDCIYNEFPSVILLGETVKDSALALHEYYCTNNMLERLMDNVGMDCEKYSETIVELSKNVYPPISPSTLPPPNTPTGDQHQNVTNEILRGMYAYYDVSLNISQFEEHHTCKHYLQGGMDCSGSHICDTHPQYDPFYCDFHKKMIDLQSAILDFINALFEVMDNNDITVVDIERQELPDTEDMVEQDLRHYSLGGIFNSIRQAEASLEGLESLCENTA